MTYLGLIRGINVGGNNKMPMSELKTCLERLGYKNVTTYIQSGNVMFESDKAADTLAREIEQTLAKTFKLKDGSVRVLVLSDADLKQVVQEAPEGFGGEPTKYHSDVIFLINKTSSQAMKEIATNPEVDNVWPGNSVIYYQRLSAKRTKSHMSKIVGKPIYKFMTIRSWNTVTKLLSKIEASEQSHKKQR